MEPWLRQAVNHLYYALERGLTEAQAEAEVARRLDGLPAGWQTQAMAYARQAQANEAALLGRRLDQPIPLAGLPGDSQYRSGVVRTTIEYTLPDGTKQYSNLDVNANALDTLRQVIDFATSEAQDMSGIYAATVTGVEITGPLI